MGWFIGRSEAMANPDTIVWRRIASAYWEETLRALVAEHVARTDSALGAQIIANWTQACVR